MFSVFASPFVALRKESVDRNFPDPPTMWSTTTSLSARRAWIEITVVGVLATLVTVALRKESVDRNNIASASFRACTSRSPQGERG